MDNCGYMTTWRDTKALKSAQNSGDLLPLIVEAECFTFLGILASSPTEERRKLLEMLLSFVAHPQMQKCLHTLQKWCSLVQQAGPAQCPLAEGIWLTLAGTMGLSVLAAHGERPLNSGAFAPICTQGHAGSNDCRISGYIKWPFLSRSCPFVFVSCFFSRCVRFYLM